MAKVFVLSGYSGSGKSTNAKELSLANPLAVMISADALLPKIKPGTDVTGLLIAIANAYLFYGIDVIVDAVNKHRNDFSRWMQLPYTCIWIDMGVDIEECIRRDARRPYPVGEVAIRKQGADW